MWNRCPLLDEGHLLDLDNNDAGAEEDVEDVELEGNDVAVGSPMTAP